MWPFDYFRSQKKLLEEIELLKLQVEAERLFSETVDEAYADSLEEIAILRKRLEDLQVRFTEYTGRDAKPVGDIIVDRPPLSKVSDTAAPFTNTPPSYTGTWVERKTETVTTPPAPTMATSSSSDMLTGMILGGMMNQHHAGSPMPTSKAMETTTAPAMKMEDFTSKLPDPAPSPVESPKVESPPSHGFHGSPSSSYESGGFGSSDSSSSSSSYSDSGSSFSSSSSDSGFSSSSDF